MRMLPQLGIMKGLEHFTMGLMNYHQMFSAVGRNEGGGEGGSEACLGFSGSWFDRAHKLPNFSAKVRSLNLPWGPGRLMKRAFD